ncbi:MAG: DUF58 domain-containing protein [Bacteroidota bacterium]
MSAFFKSIYLPVSFFILLMVNAGLFILAFLIPELLLLAKVVLLVTIFFALLDLFLLYFWRDGLSGKRNTPDKLSNGDENPIELIFDNQYPYAIKLRVIDEVPFQFQLREEAVELEIGVGETASRTYGLRPLERGEYDFGAVNAYVSGPLRLVKRKYEFDEGQMVPCYPSYVQMRKYQLMAISNRLNEFGVKQIRRLGHTTEFEQIKNYVRGDDYRTINWKATARAGKLMVNQYMDERSQPVYCLIDKSRLMQMPFEGLSLLDYAINASLVLSNIALYKQDRVGLITFCEKLDNFLPASSRPVQMNRIIESLYKQDTDFLEADYERLYAVVRRKLSGRSLLILYTNFESLSSLKRQLPYLQSIAKLHLLVVVFFENTELSGLLESRPKDLKEVYIKTIGEDFAFKKRQIAKELEKHGIISILTPPSSLTVDTLNKYLELKARGMA